MVSFSHIRYIIRKVLQEVYALLISNSISQFKKKKKAQTKNCDAFISYRSKLDKAKPPERVCSLILKKLDLELLSVNWHHTVLNLD